HADGPRKRLGRGVPGSHRDTVGSSRGKSGDGGGARHRASNAARLRRASWRRRARGRATTAQWRRERARRFRNRRTRAPRAVFPVDYAARGLTSDEAERRLADVGPNDPLAVARESALREIAEPFANPLIITLLLASGISAYVGEITSAAIIVLMVLLSVGLHLTQTYRSRRAVDRLRGSVSP